ncbi:hypothetical protein Cph01nite_04850 [Cellulomonas phragmiteti]|uniref:Uncharacterized protein n=2 Tax=Cellulomonas phragmiteti TaxID=478780 RepID=A0ABQ4DH87_9CELL|nr:hypothetical protein Cph01nite_04850 [Cellulomonas phragmiteti]
MLDEGDGAAVAPHEGATMSENPGPASSASPEHGEGQHDAPVDTGPGPDEADLHQESVGTAAQDPQEEGRVDAG